MMNRKMASIAGLALGLMSAGPRLKMPAIAPRTLPLVQAARVTSFLDTLGVNSHDNYTDGTYADIDGTLRDLHYLGIHQLREGIPDPNGGIPNNQFLQSLAKLQQDGDGFDFVAQCSAKYNSVAVQLAEIDRIQKVRPCVLAVEGPNEVNNQPCTFGGTTDPPGFGSHAAAEQFQTALYAAVRSDVHLKNVPVYFYTGGNAHVDFANPRRADCANAHPYPNHGEAPGSRISGEFSRNFSAPAPFPKVITEIGYFHNPLVTSGVDSRVQAAYTLDLLLDAYQQSIAKTYLYQLRTAYPDPNPAASPNEDAEYGLFDLGNHPRQVAVALHNLTAILADTSARARTFHPGRLAYALTGNGAGASRSLLLARSNGHFLLVLWAEPAVWDDAAHREKADAGPLPVTVRFRAPVAKAVLYDPCGSAPNGTGPPAPVRSRSHVLSVSVALGASPLIYDIQP